MTTMHELIRKCNHCGCLNKYNVVRVALSCDDRLVDKYELTKFVIENPERFRNLTWRANSSEKHIVLGVLNAEKAVVEQFGDAVKNSSYKILVKKYHHMVALD